MSEKPRFIVGAKKNPDRTWDYSQAASYEGPKQEQPAKPPSEQDLKNRREELDEIWRRSQETQKARADAERAKTGRQIETVYKQLGVESPSAREKERERAAEIVFQDGGVRIHTSVERSLSPKGNSGFQNLETRIQDGRNPSGSLRQIEAQLLSRDDSMRHKRVDDVLKEHDIKEIIDIRHETKPVYETITIPGKKGVLGIGKTPDRTERRPTGRYEPVLHSEQVIGGKKEPEVRFTYYVPQSEWRDYSSRTGQMLSVEIVLPESTAKEITQTLERDPAAMRKIV